MSDHAVLPTSAHDIAGLKTRFVCRSTRSHGGQDRADGIGLAVSIRSHENADAGTIITDKRYLGCIGTKREHADTVGAGPSSPHDPVSAWLGEFPLCCSQGGHRLFEFAPRCLRLRFA